MKSTEPPYLKHLFSLASKSRTPLSGTLEITPRCNLNCRMCYIHTPDCKEAEKREMPKEKIFGILDELQKAGTLLLLITGGEPLIRADFRDIYIKAKELGISVCVNTNGTLINQDIINLFKEYPPARVNVTLYGANGETYKNVTGVYSACEKAYAGVGMLLDAGIAVKLNMSINPQNVCDIKKVYKFAREHDLFIEGASYMFPPARSGRKFLNGDRMTPEMSGVIAAECERLAYDSEHYRIRAEAVGSLARVEGGLISGCSDESGEKIMCRAGTTSYWISYDGKLSPCGMMNEPYEDLLNSPFIGAWNKLGGKIAEIRLPAECSACKYKPICSVCAASCKAETGRFDIVPEYQCRRTRSFYLENINYLRQAVKEDE